MSINITGVVTRTWKEKTTWKVLNKSLIASHSVVLRSFLLSVLWEFFCHKNQHIA